MTRTMTERIFFAMGTVNTLTVFGGNGEAAAEKAKQRVLELHRKLSAFDERSEICRINANAGIRPTQVCADTAALIGRCAAFARETNGLFDVTIHPLSMLWKTAIRQKTPPDPQKVTSLLRLTNSRDVRTDAVRRTVTLKRRGQALDLGGAAKGYAADEVKRIFLRENAGRALINLGGTVVAVGGPYRIGVQNPLAETGVPFAYLELSDRAVVSSGRYEQGFTVNGRYFHHIIDPRTGEPADTDLIGVTLVGDSAETLDVLSTAAMLAGMEKSLPLLAAYGAEAVFVTKQNRVYTTDGLKDRLVRL